MNLRNIKVELPLPYLHCWLYILKTFTQLRKTHNSYSKNVNLIYQTGFYELREKNILTFLLRKNNMYKVL
jgi:hypothetical protein